LVEFLTALLFWFSWLGIDFQDGNGLDWHAWIAQIRVWGFISLGIAITFIDLDHRIIPDELSIGGMVFGLATSFADFRHPWGTLALGALIGFGGFYGFALIYEKLTGRSGLGGGDIKFMGPIGAFLGWGGVWSSILISSVVGSIVGITLGALQKQKGDSVLKMTIPYGPFLVLGSFIELFFEVSLWIQN
jgi:leader peptidase (prepilin peptidase)/N-methyltransferase